MATITLIETPEMKHLSRMNRAIEYQRKALVLEAERLCKLLDLNARKIIELNNEHHSNTEQYITLKSKV